MGIDPSVVPPTTERVPRHTDRASNERIARQTEASIRYHASQGRRLLDTRLRALAHEWDIERILEANAATVSLLGLALGRLVSRRFYVIPAVVAIFLLQHAVQGWCPPVSLFRRLGVRTMHEIEQERSALKLIRGDFDGLSTEKEPREVFEAVRA